MGKSDQKGDHAVESIVEVERPIKVSAWIKGFESESHAFSILAPDYSWEKGYSIVLGAWGKKFNIFGGKIRDMGGEDDPPKNKWRHVTIEAGTEGKVSYKVEDDKGAELYNKEFEDKTYTKGKIRFLPVFVGMEVCCI